jgi:hypothetical protein
MRLRHDSTPRRFAPAPRLLPALICAVHLGCGGTTSGSSPDAGTDAGTDAEPSCTPACSGKTCGPDGCGGTCGTCAAGQSCNTAGQCVSGSPVASRPNDGTGFWPDSSNTGYQNAPGYPGHLTDFPVNQGGYTLLDGSYDGQTLKFYHFHGKVMIGTSDGAIPSSVAHVSFYGCLFEGTLPNDIMVYDFSTVQSTYTYSTFKPATVSAPPVSCADSYEISVNQSGTQGITMDHCDLWGGAGVQFGASSQASPLVFTDNYLHDEADPDNAGGCNYHHDGFGPCSDGGISYVTFAHNTIASLGNTNGIALQGNLPYDHVSITDNYISGWGYAVSIGAGNTAASDTNVTVTGNVFSGQFTSLFGPLYGNVPPGAGSKWKGNLYQVRAGDPWGQVAWDGQYWWPTDAVGHASDYP